MTPTAQPQPPVVVGFDGTDRSMSALEYAVGEASRRGATLRVVHVAARYPENVLEQVRLEQEITELDAAVEESVAHLVGRTAPDLAVEVRHRRGAPSRVLLSESAGTQLVVLGREHKGVLERAITGATTAEVVARSSVPTVVVPAHWAGHRPRPVVLVGLRDRTGADVLLRNAFEHAQRSAGTVRVLEAEICVDDATSRAAAEEHGRVADRWQRAYPDVHVQVDMVEADAEDALAWASREADLMLVLRGRSPVLPPHLGRVLRAVLQTASCPVEVVPARSVTIPLELERDGELLR